jgi:hypothetical protein
MLAMRFKGFVGALVVVGALGGASVAVATVSSRSSSVLAPATAARAHRRPRVEEGCRELPVAPVTPPPPASCS